MIKARHTPVHVRFFNLFSAVMLNRHFRAVQVHFESDSFPKAVCLVGNHFSWWDGFIANYLAKKVFDKKLYIMMLEKELKSRMFLNKAGAFSVNRESRSMIESMNYSVEVLQESGNLLAMYPQGKIESMHIFPFTFDRGLERIRSRSEDHHLVFYAAVADYFSHKKPQLDIYLKMTLLDKTSSIEDIQEGYNSFYRDSIHSQSQYE
ncbi:MAG TPA: hypothetical protein DDX92_03305 [Flavobacteriales bacterium]|jgi:hypothetical protein|nr:hypothetical protein [Flavobacteriales bacterium]